MLGEQISINTASGEVICPSEVERIAAYVSKWGRKSEERPYACDHRLDGFCEQYGCSSFEELADEIRKKFGARAPQEESDAQG